METMPTKSRRLLFGAVLTLSVWCSVGRPTHGQEKDTPANNPPAAKINDELRQELLRRSKEDQEARKRFLEAMGRHGPSDPVEAKKQRQDPEAGKLQEVDRANTARMKEIVAKYGWPGKSLVGADGAHAAWLVIQHADLDRPFQKRCLDLVRQGFKLGEATGEQVAYLTDRVLVGENKKQLYGTQFQQRDGKWVPNPIEDEANVDKRRREVGLSPLAEYEKLLKKMYEAKGPDK
jgi:hypothetical protein